MRPVGVVDGAEEHRGARCRDHHPGARRPLHQGVSQGTRGDRRELGRLHRAFRRSRPHPRREADRYDRPQPPPAHPRQEAAANRLIAGGPDMAQQEWTMLGQYMESCNCDYLCPCVYTNPQGPATYDHCTAALVFRIDAGRYGDTKLDGLKFALLIRSGKVMADGNWVFAG